MSCKVLIGPKVGSHAKFDLLGKSLATTGLDEIFIL